MEMKLVLGDGTVISGKAFGALKSISGEVVFNTGMVGYPETFTDPSYYGQILVLTYPLIGNYGVPPFVRKEGIVEFYESSSIKIKGLVISDYSFNYSHWNAKKSLSQWLKENDIPGIYGVDTREITKKLREKGTMLGKIKHNYDVDFFDPNKHNIVSEVSIKDPIVYGKGKKTIMLIDCGVKNSIITSLLKRDVTVIRVPWDYDIHNGKYDYDGILISNGPGDPKMCKETIKNIKAALEYNIPVFGICLGNQLLALAAGADTYKLKYGHRSQNQPCVDKTTGRCYITSQNHGFAVKTKTLPKQWEPWFVNANDKTNEGIRHKKKPFMSVQFHPEATPGPVDTAFLFDEFIKKMR